MKLDCYHLEQIQEPDIRDVTAHEVAKLEATLEYWEGNVDDIDAETERLYKEYNRKTHREHVLTKGTEYHLGLTSTLVEVERDLQQKGIDFQWIFDVDKLNISVTSAGKTRWMILTPGTDIVSEIYNFVKQGEQ